MPPPEVPELERRTSSRPGRPRSPYPPGRGTAGSTRICVGDTCSSHKSATTSARRTSPCSGRCDSFRRLFCRFISDSDGFQGALVYR